MAPYFEIDGNFKEPVHKMGTPLSAAIKERKVTPGETVILIDSQSVYNADNGLTVEVKVLSDDNAEVLVKTKDGDYKPGSVTDEAKPNSVWFGAVFWPENSIGRKRRQKTFVTERKTISVSGLKRVEWRNK